MAVESRALVAEPECHKPGPIRVCPYRPLGSPAGSLVLVLHPQLARLTAQDHSWQSTQHVYSSIQSCMF